MAQRVPTPPDFRDAAQRCRALAVRAFGPLCDLQPTAAAYVAALAALDDLIAEAKDLRFKAPT